MVQATLNQAVHRRLEESDLLRTEAQGDVEGVLFHHRAAEDLPIPLGRASDVAAIEADVLNAFDGEGFHWSG